MTHGDKGLRLSRGAADPADPADDNGVGSRAVFPCFMDFEASSLRHGSYPIEVAWSLENGRIESWLIDPSGVPAWTDWDTEVERDTHGLSRDMLRLLGRSPRWVTRRLNTIFAGRALSCDGGQFDHFWLYRLFKAAGVRPTFELVDAGDLFERYLAPATLTAFAEEARRLIGRRHRAALDVSYLQALWRLIAAQSDDAHWATAAASQPVRAAGTCRA
ncbi:MAG: hypothetical protein ACREWG_13085 [Gammaproteobacteria bacterium]